METPCLEYGRLHQSGAKWPEKPGRDGNRSIVNIRMLPDREAKWPGKPGRDGKSLVEPMHSVIMSRLNGQGSPFGMETGYANNQW